MKEIKDVPTNGSSGCWTFYFPKRYILVALGFLGIFNTFAMRVNLSQAIVAMVNQTATAPINKSLECMNMENETFLTEEFGGEKYNWDTGTQGAILGSYYYGYVITQLPGGLLAERFGAKWVFGGGVFGTAIFCLLSPVAASWGTIAFISVRVLQGASDGLTIPAMNCAISVWSPETERSRFSTIIFSGVMVGTVAAMPISGILCSTNFLGGWPSVFYVFGIFSCIWFVFWCIFFHETPSLHPNISKDELLYIEKNKEILPLKSTSVSWFKVMTSLPAWSVLIAHIGHNFGFLIMLTEIPTYLSSVLHFNLASNGLLSALPFICETLSAFIASFVADGLRKAQVMNITSIRKLMNSIGLFGPALCLIGITLSGCETAVIIILLCLAMTLNGSIFSGFNVTHVDMCPKNPGTLYAITNGVSSLTGIIGPLIVGAFTRTGATRANWSNVFYTTAAVYIFCGAFFALFASAELQHWDISTKDRNVELKKDKNLTETGQKTKL